MKRSTPTQTMNFSMNEMMTAKRKSERLCAEAALARYAQERQTRDASFGRAAIDSPLFANV
jgi:hypothetical protein